MKLLDKKTSADLVRMTIFIVVTTLATSLLVVTIGNITFSDKKTYQAVFSDVTGVVSGTEVRIAGVRVGTVEGVEIVDRGRAEVTFTVQAGTTLTRATNASIRYRNLVGQRYIALNQRVGDSSVLEAGETIPIEQTDPALDLTVLFNGFKPLFEALSPSDVNKLSFEIIQVFQGEAGTVESLLRSTASLTKTLADRDRLIGELLDNLDYVLDFVADRDRQLTQLITSFRDLVEGLKNDRQAILDSLDGISELSEQTAGLVKGIRAPFVNDIKQLRRLAGNIDENKAELDRALQVLPIKLNKVGRTAIYGAWFNFYLCDFKGNVRLPDQLAETLPNSVDGGDGSIAVEYNVNADRCDLG